MTTEFLTTQDQIQSRIFTIRGVQVMLDRDLAQLYEVETKALNQAVKRNRGRFPEHFMFRLTEEEMETLLPEIRSRSQFVTLNGDDTQSHKTHRGQNIKYLPYVFTEQGVSQLTHIAAFYRIITC